MVTASTHELQSLLEGLTAKHNIPGATVAVLDGDAVTEAATGVINKNTGVEVTTDTLFQIGSTTKPYSATLVMQLVDDGEIELDKPVRVYLPEFKLADPEATESVTVRQLLCHTSGMDEEVMKDTGRGDDCIREYVATLASVPQTSPPGRIWSYSNSGLVVAGRLVEELTGQTWNTALKERLLNPLGAQRTVTLPEEAILHRAAVGHFDPINSGELTPVSEWMWPRSIGPAGGIISTAAEVLSFARLHLNEGVAVDGTTVLSKRSARAMQQQQVALPDKPDKSLPNAWGLGWGLFDWDGQRVIGHDGAGIGQRAFLRIAPQAGFAVVLLTNGTTGNIHEDLFKRLFAEYVAIEVPETAESAEAGDDFEFDPSLYVGTYQGATKIRIQVDEHDGGLVGSIDLGMGGVMKKLNPGARTGSLIPIDKTNFLSRVPDWGEKWPFIFFDFDESGRPLYLHAGGRSYPRVDESHADMT